MNEITKVEPGTLSDGYASGAPAVVQPGALLDAMMQFARDPAFDVAKLEALAKLQQQMEDRAAERMLTAALQQAQAEIPQIEKRGSIPKKDGKSIPFLTEQDIDTALRPVCQKYGFTLHYSTETPRPGLIVVTTTLRHAAGASVSASVSLPIDEGPGRNTTQAHGSTMSYGRRYGKEMLFNIVRRGADDDGASAHKRIITREQADAVLLLLKEVGREESIFLERLFGGSVRSVDEIPADAIDPVMNTLLGIKQQQARKVP